MRKFLSVFSVILIFLMSCGRQGGNQPEPIRVAVSQEPPTLDVMINTSLISRMIAVGNVYEKLLVMDADGNIRTELAESYSLSGDSKTLTFIIRNGVEFHDGSAFDPEDALLSMNRWLDVYKAASDIAGNARFYEIDGGIEISSDSSLAFLPVLIASSPQCAVIMPSEIIMKAGNGELVTDTVGTGPYKIKEWNPGEKLELEAFEHYAPYGEKNKARTDSIIYYFVSDSVTRSLGMLSGEYDFANDVMSEDRALYNKKGSGISVIEGSESGSIGIIFNKKDGIGRDAEFRRAVSLAIDREKIMKSCYGEYGWSIHSDYMEKEQPFSIADDNPYNGQNINMAKAELEESTYRGERVRILAANSSNMDKLAIALADDLNKIGISTELVIVDWSSMMARRSDSSSWDILISAYSSVPLPQMKLYLSPSYPGWIDENEEGLMLMSEMNDSSYEKSLEIWRDAQYALWETVPAVVPGHYITAYAKSDELHDVIISNGFFFWNAYKKEGH